MLQARRSRDRIPMRWIFFKWPNPSGRTMALGSTQPLTEMSTRNIPGGKGRPAHKADNLTAICEPIVQKMWEPQHLTTLWASTACYRPVTLPLYIYIYIRLEEYGSGLIISCARDVQVFLIHLYPLCNYKMIHFIVWFGKTCMRHTNDTRIL
jgi:hypothetical protein